VSRSGALHLVRELERLERELSGRYLPAIERDYERAANTTVGSFQGRGVELINEAQVRSLVLDQVLQVLGWRIDTTEHMIIEAPAEDEEAQRRFLDYYGRERGDGRGAGLLVVEAKRLSLALPSAPGLSALDCVREALRDFRRDDSPLTQEWKSILTSAADYVRRLDQTSADGAPRRFLLSNGRWYLVFLEPLRTLVHGTVNEADLLVVESPAHAASVAPELHQLLSYESLCSVIPPQKSDDFARFIQGEPRALLASIAIEVGTGEVSVRPLMAMAPVVHVRVPRGGWVRFRLEETEGDPVVLRKDSELRDDMEEIESHAGRLVDALNAQHPVELVDAARFEAERPGPQFPATRLLDREAPNSFVLHLGDRCRPLLDTEDFDNCPFHAHGPAHAIGRAVPDAPILRRSSNPPAYFPSGSALHCAHRGVHRQREENCRIRALDDFLCCRRCALQTRCWPDGFDGFPCQRG
jgi:hypothetical protein